MLFFFDHCRDAPLTHNGPQNKITPQRTSHGGGGVTPDRAVLKGGKRGKQFIIGPVILGAVRCVCRGMSALIGGGRIPRLLGGFMT